MNNVNIFTVENGIFYKTTVMKDIYIKLNILICACQKRQYEIVVTL